jgi:CheY-like chemotaxis protein
MEANTLSNKIILVVDDEIFNFKLLERHLKSFDAQVLWAENGEDAIKICNQSNDKLALVLMDLKLPGMDGFEISSLIKQKYPNMPIIVQTANASLFHLNDSNIHFDGFLAKPIRRTHLYEIIKKVLNLN